MHKSNKIENREVWEDLVISMLSVNNFPLEKAHSLLPRLRTVKITEPVTLASSNFQAIAKSLIEAGYDRGDYMTSLFAERLVSLGELIKSKGVEECERVLCSSNLIEIKNFLSPVKGIGPVVMQNFSILQSDCTPSGPVGQLGGGRT